MPALLVDTELVGETGVCCDVSVNCDGPVLLRLMDVEVADVVVVGID